MQLKNFFAGLIIFVFILFSALAMADRTDLVGFPYHKQVFSGNVDVRVEIKNFEGIFSGAVIGEYNNNFIWLSITSGDYAGYGFGMGTSEGTIGCPPYIEMQDYVSNFINAKKPEHGYVAVYGDFGAIGYANPTELTSLFGTQYSGTFYAPVTNETVTDIYNTVPLEIYISTGSFSLSGYYSGTMTITGLTFDFVDVSNLDPFQEWGIDELVGFIGAYDWSETGVGDDGEIYFVYTEPIHLGAVTGELKGVLVADLENYTAFIEHAGTAPPIPIPSTLLLLGSGLIGVLAIRKSIGI
ncbi:MAG: hypothetical protein LWW95_05845 [Candidatus Desulfofervidus auxilii]|nr:hypothetical protein [Candidatus Desulfofervidus auxilii]